MSSNVRGFHGDDETEGLGGGQVAQPCDALQNAELSAAEGTLWHLSHTERRSRQSREVGRVVLTRMARTGLFASRKQGAGEGSQPVTSGTRKVGRDEPWSGTLPAAAAGESQP